MIIQVCFDAEHKRGFWCGSLSARYRSKHIHFTRVSVCGICFRVQVLKICPGCK